MKNHPLRTSVIGSYPFPGWLEHAVTHLADFGKDDIAEVQDIKRIIRESEAVSGIEVMGLNRSHARFLNLPFYQTGKVRKDPIGPEDVAIVRRLLEERTSGPGAPEPALG